jgi:hypothetical protein
MGICSDFMAEPFHRFRSLERAVIAEHLKQINLFCDKRNGVDYG